MTQNMNRKHEKHTVTPLQKEVTDRLTMYAASLGTSIHRRRFFVKWRRADVGIRPCEETDSHASVSTGSE